MAAAVKLSDVKMVMRVEGPYSNSDLVRQISGLERLRRAACRQMLIAHANAHEAFMDRATPATWGGLVAASRKPA
jgi:hypothetical protein